MASKTMEDWFLRGGEKPAQENASSNPDARNGKFPQGSPHESGDGDGEEKTLQEWIVTMSCTYSVQRTAKVRVKAHSEEEAKDLADGRIDHEAEIWHWEDVDGTEEFDCIGADEAEVAT